MIPGWAGCLALARVLHRHRRDDGGQRHRQDQGHGSRDGSQQLRGHDVRGQDLLHTTSGQTQQQEHWESHTCVAQHQRVHHGRDMVPANFHRAAENLPTARAGFQFVELVDS